MDNLNPEKDNLDPILNTDGTPKKVRWISFFKEKEKLQALVKKHAASKEAQELADTLYVAGVVDYLYVNIIERDHFFTENALAESQKQEITKLISIYKALGGGWECSGSP